MDEKWHVVIEVWESDSILCSDRLTNYNFVDVVEFIPIFVSQVVIFDEGLKLWTTWDSHVESFRSEKAFWIE